ncbi:MAG: FAD-binding oxidoreductase, partial [Chloroflexi bacterium]|nr:FAD-binding oxidoreductase [Chloroflexota bacterium]
MDSRALAEELRRQIVGEVRFDKYSRVLYSTDASIYQIEPLGVVIPKNNEDVIAAIKTAARYSVPVLPRGGGTSLAGQAVGPAIILDFSKYMHRVLEMNPEEGWVRAEPGISLDGLNHNLRSYGLKFAPDPTTSNRATVGGVLGNNSCGSHSILFGKTVDNVKEISVVLPDGDEALFKPLTQEELEAKLRGEGAESQLYRRVLDIVEQHRQEIALRYPKIMRRVSGYNLDEFTKGEDLNLAKLIVGSEGTLATITEAKLHLVPRP